MVIPKNRYSIALLGGAIGFLVSGLGAGYVKLLRMNQDLLWAAIWGGISAFLTLVSIDALTEWVGRRNRRPQP